jgi:hypothetical protein
LRIVVHLARKTVIPSRTGKGAADFPKKGVGAYRIELVTSYRHLRRAILLSAVALVLVMAQPCRSPALAQGKLDAHYTVTLAGLPIGHGNWTIDIGDSQFSTSASGTTAGLLRIFASGQGQSVARGAISGGHLVSSTYSSSISTDKKYDEVHMVISAGTVKEFSAEPPNTPNASRVPLTEAHRHGVSDPMTASLVRIPGNGDTIVPQGCQRTLSVFDGRMRYDLQLGFKRFDTVASQSGYQGRVVVCSVRFSPIAGHVPDRYAIKYLTEQQDMEMWLAPIAGTRLIAPYRISIPTPVGVGVLEATQFIAVPHPGRASVKIQ